MCLHACYHAGMAQLTIRAEDELVSRVRLMAKRSGRSINEYVTAVLDAATNPEFAASEAEQLRERLAAAGILAALPPSAGSRPSKAAIVAAGRRAVGGKPLSDHVAESR